MPIPDFQSVMLPLLQFAADGQVHSMKDARQHLAAHFSLTEAEQAELLPSGRQATFSNRVAWAKVYLDKAGLLEAPQRGSFKITAAGQKVLAESPKRINIHYLERFPEFIEFRSKRTKPPSAAEPTGNEESATPEERLQGAYDELRGQLADDLLGRVKSGTPAFFEQMVVELLLKMGYGGSRKEAGQAIGKGGDEGIDGVISEDRLGLDVIYLQAKRWEGTVGRPEVQKFVGALHGKRAKKGVFLTTGTFSADARSYVDNIDPKVVLIDGQRLSELMIEFGIGVTPAESYQVNRLDQDYFEED